MKCLPFTGEMFAAAIGGRKDVTRRLIPIPPTARECRWWTLDRPEWVDMAHPTEPIYSYPRYLPGEVVHLGCPHLRFGGPNAPAEGDWVWDEWSRTIRNRKGDKQTFGAPEELAIATAGRRAAGRYLPGWAATHWARILSARAERVREITPNEVAREGLLFSKRYVSDSLGGWGYQRRWGMDGKHLIAENAFAALWDSINAKRGYSWKANPWVWRYEFVLCDREGKALKGATP